MISTSLFGIAVPFACGVALAYALPAELIPSPATPLVTALFLGTALSISSVKIVAMVLMEVGAIRRDLGQLILATAILDDTHRLGHHRRHRRHRRPRGGEPRACRRERRGHGAVPRPSASPSAGALVARHHRLGATTT